MKRLLSTLAIALASFLVIGGDAVITGGASAHSVDVSPAIPVTLAASAAPLRSAPAPLSPDALRLSAVAGAVVPSAAQGGETAEDAAVNNSDLTAAPAEQTQEPAEPVSVSIQALGVVNGTGVRMRSQPDTDSDILETLGKNTLVELTVQQGDWYRISYDGQRGYVSAQYITRYDAASDLNGAGKVTADVLNIRSAPKSGASSLGTASYGAVLTVTGIDGSWFAVTYKGVSGYVASRYVLICSPDTEDTSAPAVSAEASEEAPAETPEEPAVETPAGTISGSSVVSLAQQYLGTPYVYGGSSPDGFDCSGFTMYIFSQAGIKLPHGATSQLSYGTAVSRSELQPGDLVFFQDYGAVASHVGIYIGDDQFIHASSSYSNGHCVVTSSLSETYYNNHYYTARRH